MAKKNPDKTPKSKIKQALRQLWLRSRERASACKREKYTCERCGIKQSVAKGKEVKINVHHRSLIQWEEIISYIYERLLCPPIQLEVLCIACHDDHHKEDKYGKA